MASGVGKKIIKWLLIGGGTVLSFINPAIGAPLIVAGTAIKTGTETSSDLVSVYGANLNTAIETANAMTAGANVNTLLNKIILFFQKYFLIILIAIGAIIVLPKILKRRRK